MDKKEYSLTVDGKDLVVSFSDLTDQAHGAVQVRYGDTVVLVTAVMSKKAKEGVSYLPLSVEYEERFYATGKILGGRFMKREGRPSDEAILTGRVVDRTIRPLFDHSIRNDIQVAITVLSIDEDNDPDVPAVIGASLALATSDIPWAGPVSSVRIGVSKEDPKLCVNPHYRDREEALLDLLVCGKDGAVNMIEAEAREVEESVLDKAFVMSLAEIKKIQEFQKEIISKEGKKKRELSKKETDTELVSLFKKEIEPKLEKAVFSGAGKAGIYALKDEWMELLSLELPESSREEASFLLEEKVNNIVHKEAVENDRRPDDRKMDEVREIKTTVGGISPIVHGVGTFYRGGTHMLSVLTLGGPGDAQLIDGMEVRGEKYFMHHYNFPPFSVGETGRMAPSRRSVGHGALAEKSLRGILPSREDFPYTIRVVSEVMASNGSSSMGSVCGATLAMMDGGVPIKNPAAGIAMGLMLLGDKYKVLTDIQGPEDEHGDMDFKVAGTEKGVTGIQLDIKLDGVTPKILAEALVEAKNARVHIIEKIREAIPEPRAELLPSAPNIIRIKINPEKIGAVIGPGGKMIQQITADTDTHIDISDDGVVLITGLKDGAEAAKKVVEDITREYTAGEKFNGEITRLMDFGLFVKVGHNTEGLVHISEIAPFRIEDLSGKFEVGEKVPVVIKEIDDKGRMNLSIKATDPEFAKKKGFGPKEDKA